MKIKIYVIAKNYLNGENYAKMANQFGVNIEVINIFNAKIQNAQKTSPQNAQNAYESEFSKFITKDSIALDLNGKQIDSMAFSDLLKDRNHISFFVGGAYGFSKSFLQKMPSIALSKLTFSHSLVPLILCEQIYRALSIINNHPYHK